MTEEVRVASVALNAKETQVKVLETQIVLLEKMPRRARRQSSTRAELDWIEKNTELLAINSVHELAKWTAAPATDHDATKKLEIIQAKVDQLAHYYAVLRQKEDAAHTLTLASQK